VKFGAKEIKRPEVWSRVQALDRAGTRKKKKRKIKDLPVVKVKQEVSV
jgi:hypothetical protein